MKKYILDINLSCKDGAYNAGSKARNDIDEILISEGCLRKTIVLEGKKSPICRIIERLKLIMCVIGIESNSLLIIQYPFYYAKSVYRILTFICERKNIKTCLWIHDCNSLRFDGKISVKSEINIFNSFDYVVVHNYRMFKELSRLGMRTKYQILDVFDYIKNENMEIKEKCDSNNVVSKDLIIAGNLTKDKAGYIYDLINKYNGKEKIILYGKGFDKSFDKKDRIEYKGFFNPSNIPFKNGFGIIWDGPSAEDCIGNFGHYLRFNNPHKLSLYLVAGIPVITWKRAAIADFITKNNVGIVLDSLLDIDDALNNLSDEQITIMRENAKNIGNKLNKGYYSRKVVNSILSEL